MAWVTFGLTLAFAPHVERAVLAGVVLAVAVHLLREIGLRLDVRADGMTLAPRPAGILWFATASNFRDRVDFPMPEHLPDFARHDQIAAYFDAYVDHCGFRDRITLQTGVQHVERRDDGGFDVSLSTGETRGYDAVCVANGHHWDPRWPEPVSGTDTFTGEQMHSHSYVDESQLVGRKVVVPGMGNSAMDIAVDASYHAQSTYLAARRGAHIVPKYLFGRPYDQFAGSERIPAWMR